MHRSIQSFIYRSGLCTVMLVSFIPGLFAQSTGIWTLKRCLEYSRENNITIQQVQLSTRNAKYDRTGAIADLFPTLNASMTHSFNFGLSFDPTSFQQKNQQYQTSGYSLSSRFIIFNGLANYYQVAAAGYTYKATVADFQQAIDDVSLNIIQLYLAVLFAQERLEIVKQQVEALRLQVERTSILHDAGIVTRGDLLLIQSQLSTQEVTLVNGDNALSTAKLALIQALNLPGMDIEIEKPDISSIEIKDPDQNLTAERVYETALGLRPNILSREYRLHAARKTLGVLRGGYYPVISLTGSVSTAFSELRKTNPLDPLSPTIPYIDQLEQNNAQVIGLGLTIPIFNGLSTRMAVQKSKVSLRLAELDLENEKLRLRNTIQQAYTDALSASKTFRANERNLEAQEEAYDYSRARLEVGSINIVEFNDVSNRYFNAKTELLIAQYDYVFKTKVLDFYRGEVLDF